MPCIPVPGKPAASAASQDLGGSRLEWTVLGQDVRAAAAAHGCAQAPENASRFCTGCMVGRHLRIGRGAAPCQAWTPGAVQGTEGGVGRTLAAACLPHAAGSAWGLSAWGLTDSDPAALRQAGMAACMPSAGARSAWAQSDGGAWEQTASLAAAGAASAHCSGKALTGTATGPSGTARACGRCLAAAPCGGLSCCVRSAQPAAAAAAGQVMGTPGEGQGVRWGVPGVLRRAAGGRCGGWGLRWACWGGVLVVAGLGCQAGPAGAEGALHWGSRPPPCRHRPGGRLWGCQRWQQGAFAAAPAGPAAVPLPLPEQPPAQHAELGSG